MLWLCNWNLIFLTSDMDDVNRLKYILVKFSNFCINFLDKNKK